MLRSSKIILAMFLVTRAAFPCSFGAFAANEPVNPLQWAEAYLSAVTVLGDLGHLSPPVRQSLVDKPLEAPDAVPGDFKTLWMEIQAAWKKIPESERAGALKSLRTVLTAKFQLRAGNEEDHSNAVQQAAPIELSSAKPVYRTTVPTDFSFKTLTSDQTFAVTPHQLIRVSTRAAEKMPGVAGDPDEFSVVFPSRTDRFLVSPKRDGDYDLHIWDPVNQTRVALQASPFPPSTRFRSNQSRGLSWATSADGSVAAVAATYATRFRFPFFKDNYHAALNLYDTATGKLLQRKILERSYSLSNIALSANGEEAWMFTDDAMKLYKWNVKPNTLDSSPALFGDGILAPSPREKTIGLFSIDLQIINLKNAKVKLKIEEGMENGEFSPDGKWYVQPGRYEAAGQIQLIDVETGQFHVFEYDERWGLEVAFDSTSRRLVVQTREEHGAPKQVRIFLIRDLLEFQDIDWK